MNDTPQLPDPDQLPLAALLRALADEMDRRDAAEREWRQRLSRLEVRIARVEGEAFAEGGGEVVE